MRSSAGFSGNKKRKENSNKIHNIEDTCTKFWQKLKNNKMQLFLNFQAGSVNIDVVLMKIRY